MIRPIEFSEDQVVGMEIDGGITRDDIDQFWTIVEDKLTRHAKLRVYAEIRNFGGVEFKSWFTTLPRKLGHFTHFEKEAIVSDKTWLSTLAKVSDKLFPSIEVRHFGFEDKTSAREWVRG